MTHADCGYVEGYYGRLFDWQERKAIVDVLARNNLGRYLYAPKEDIKHRYRWREPYDKAWLQQFADFCAYANQHKVSVIAGVAPGLDFDFGDLPSSADFNALLSKCLKLIEYGADDICLLMDDIDADFHKRSGSIESEGKAHALLANILADQLPGSFAENTANTANTTHIANPAGRAIQVVPRIYADELSADTTAYLPHFIETLDNRHTVLYCGSNIVAESVCQDEIENYLKLTEQKIIVWDNLYANDYCPRRLFLGPWSGRSNAGSVLLNPTGMVHTDCLLLDIMAATIRLQVANGVARSTENASDASKPDFLKDAMALDVSEDATAPDASENAVAPDASKAINGSDIANSAWRTVLEAHQVPEQFYAIAEYFCHPVFNSRQWQSIDSASQEQFDAIEYLLWRWKTPLSREWYPFIMSLKHDLLINAGQLPELRIQKTQSPALAEHLLSRD